MSKEYFPHDYGARVSLRGIRKDYGLQGVGFYWCFVEMLHEEGGYIKEDDLDNIAYDLQVEPELCRAITHNYDLFVVKKGKIYSDRVLRNIKKRAEISAARKSAANQRWGSQVEGGRDEPPSAAPPERVEPEKEISDEEREYFEGGVEFYTGQLQMRLSEWEEQELKNREGDTFAILVSPVNEVRVLLENLFNVMKGKRTQKINGQNVDTLEFMRSIMSFFKNDESISSLLNVICEVNEKAARGEIKNKQNYLISALYNTVKLNGG